MSDTFTAAGALPDEQPEMVPVNGKPTDADEWRHQVYSRLAESLAVHFQSVNSRLDAQDRARTLQDQRSRAEATKPPPRAYKRKLGVLERLWAWAFGSKVPVDGDTDAISAALRSKEAEADSLRLDVAHARQKLAEAESALKIHELEIRKLALVCERDRQRVQAEMAGYVGAAKSAERSSARDQQS